MIVNSSCNIQLCFVTEGAGDTTPPDVTGCPTQEIVRTVLQGQTSAVVTWPEPTATDDSGGQVTRDSNRMSGQMFGLGSVDVRYVFTDPSGNQAFCTFTVTVRGECMLYGIHSSHNFLKLSRGQIIF